MGNLMAERAQNLLRVFLHQPRSLLNTFCLFVLNKISPCFLKGLSDRWCSLQSQGSTLPSQHPGLPDGEAVCDSYCSPSWSLLKLTTVGTGLGVCALWIVLGREVQGLDLGKIPLWYMQIETSQLLEQTRGLIQGEKKCSWWVRSQSVPSGTSFREMGLWGRDSTLRHSVSEWWMNEWLNESEDSTTLIFSSQTGPGSVVCTQKCLANIELNIELLLCSSQTQHLCHPDGYAQASSCSFGFSDGCRKAVGPSGCFWSQRTDGRAILELICSPEISSLFSAIPIMNTCLYSAHSLQHYWMTPNSYWFMTSDSWWL